MDEIEYIRTQRFHRRVIGPAGDVEWGVLPDNMRSEGTIYMRTVEMPTFAFIGSEEQAAIEFTEAPEVIDE